MFDDINNNIKNVLLFCGCGRPKGTTSIEGIIRRDLSPEVEPAVPYLACCLRTSRGGFAAEST